MTVVAVRPIKNTRGGVDAEGNQTYENVYEVDTDDKNDGSDTARLSPAAFALGLPAYNDEWRWFNDYNPYAICKTREAVLRDENETRKLWVVTCGYTSKDQKRDSSGGGGTGEPVYEPWKISGSYANGTKATNRDKDDKLVTNSADEPKLTEVPHGYDTLILEGNSDVIDLAQRALAQNRCNSTSIWGLPQRSVLLSQWAYDIAYKATTPYVHHRFEFWIKPDGELWNLELADTGTRYIVDAAETDPNTRYKSFTARDEKLQEECWLDGAGSPLDMVASPNGFFITRKLIKEFNFTNITYLPDPLPGPFI